MQTIKIYNKRPSLVALPAVRGSGGVTPSLKLMPGENEVPKHVWDALLQSKAVQGFVFGKGRFLSTDPGDMPDMKEIPRIRHEDIPPERAPAPQKGVELGPAFNGTKVSAREQKLQAKIDLQEEEMFRMKAQLAGLKADLEKALTIPAPSMDRTETVIPPPPVAEKVEQAKHESITDLKVATARELILSTKDIALLEEWESAEERKTVLRELRKQKRRLERMK